MPIADTLRQRWSAWQRGGAICSEMEAASIFIVASVLGVRAGAVVDIHGLDQAGEPSRADASLDRLLDTAVDAMGRLIAQG
jgi:uridine phosphorylase